LSAVYVDTSALLPLLDGSDRDHLAVKGAVEALVHENATLVTASYVLVETGALAKRRLGAAAFRALGDVAERAMRVVWVDEALHAEAWSRAATEGRDGPSLVDWVSFLVMRRAGAERVLALDGHFTRQGFRTIP
jgi:predicted nucleic acid-binding protein